MKTVNLIVLYFLLGLIIVYLVVSRLSDQKIVYVDNVELFSNFKMKAELEKKYKEVESLRKSILDSIYTEIKIKSDGINKTDQVNLNFLKRAFIEKKELFEKENSETMAHYNDQIWNQLNDYTKQFAEENNYEFVFGANGQGVLMYAKGTKNVTKELLEFSNTKFNGK